MSKFFVFFAIFISGFSNEIFRVNIGKMWSGIEILCFLNFIFVVFVNRFRMEKNIFPMLFILMAILISLIVNFNNFPFEHYIGDTKSLATSYGSRMILSFYQMVFLLLCFVSTYNILIHSKLKSVEIERLAMYAVSTFSLFGILFLIMNLLGMTVPIIQSNEKSYGIYRLYSFALEPQFAGLYIAIGLAISVRMKNKLHIAINTISILLTVSTTVILGFACAFVYYIYKKNNIRLKIMLSPMIVLVLLLAFYYSSGKVGLYYQLLTTGEELDMVARVKSLYVAISLLLDNPYFGIGWGNFSYYFEWRGEEVITNVANIILRILTDVGFVGFLFYIPFFIWCYKLFKISDYEYRAYFVLIFVYFSINSTAFLQPSFWVLLQYVHFVSNNRDVNIGKMG